MATKVTPEIIEQINELYLELGVKAQVARKLGLSPSTVSKYIIPDYGDRKQIVKSEMTQSISFPIEDFMGEYGTMGDLCALSDDEWEDLKSLQKEVLI